MTTLLDQRTVRNGPILIGGVGGSGTRLVARILGDIGLPMGGPLNNELDALPFEMVCEAFTTPVLEQTGSPNYSLEVIDPALRSRVLRALELAAATHVEALSATGIWVAKSPRLLHFMPFLAVAFPGARFVHVVRDGRDMALSLNQNQPRKHFRAMFRDTGPEDPATRAMRFWSHANVHAAAFGKLTMGYVYQTVRYEDLCAAPETAIRTLLAQLGLTINAAALSRLAGRVKPSPTQGRWRELDTPARAELAREGRRGLAFFGYVPPDSARPLPHPPAGGRKPKAVLVTGCHRSGTSLAAGVLSGLGFDVGRSEMPPTADNPVGYWENISLVARNDQLLRALDQNWSTASSLPESWGTSPLIETFTRLAQETLSQEMAPNRHWCLKDPRLGRVLGPWLEVLRRMGREAKVLLVLRHPMEVAASLAARDQLSHLQGLRLWAMDLRRSARDSRDVDCKVMLYDRLLDAPEDSRAEIARFVDVDPTAGVQDAGRDPTDRDLKHHSIETVARVSDVALARAIDDAWAAAVRFADDPSRATRETLDAVLSALVAATENSWLDERAADMARREAETASERLRNERALDNARTIASAGSVARALERVVVRPLPETEGSSKYQRWIETIEPARHRLPRIGERGADGRLSLSAVIVLPPHDGQRPSEPPLDDPVPLLVGPNVSLAATAATLRHWSWPSDLPASPTMEKFPGGDWLRELLAETSATWFIFIEPDTRIEAILMEVIADAIARSPEAVVLHGDYDFEPRGGRRDNPVFKPPAWDDDLHLQQHILRGWFAVRRDGLAACPDPIGRSALEISYALSLMVTERAGPDRVVHIPHILAHRRPAAAREALLSSDAFNRIRGESLARRGWNAALLPGSDPMTAHIAFSPRDRTPGVSVVVPTRDGGAHLARCLHGLRFETEYDNLEIILIDNGSVDSDTLATIESLAVDPRCKVIRHDRPFNFAEIVNLGVEHAGGEMICMLNDDVGVLHPGWLREMVGLAARPDVGMVGALLLFDDGTVQHGGVALGLEGHVAGHIFHYARESIMRRRPLSGLVRQSSAVTAACAVMRRDVYRAVGGMDADYLAVNYNDLDLSLKVRQGGLKVLWTPYARLVHSESLSRGKENRPDRVARSNVEGGLIAARWRSELSADRFWNPNFSVERTVPELSFLPAGEIDRAETSQWTRERLLDASEPVARSARILPRLLAFHAAKFAIHLGRADLAVVLAREALVQEPSDYTANLAAGTCFGKVDQVTTAAWLYRNACLISPTAIRPWIYRGLIAIEREEFDAARHFLEVALHRDPFNEQALAALERIPGASPASPPVPRPAPQPTLPVALHLDPKLTQAAYTDWIARYDTLNDKDRALIHARIDTFTSPPLFSLIMPAHEPDAGHFRAAIQSAVDQLYRNWELCIADDGSNTLVAREIVEEFAALGHPIRLVRDPSPKGIAAASNAALSLASGDFVVFLDHDDVLAEHALYMLAESLSRDDKVDLLYSDEDKLDEAGRRYSPHFKPAFNYDLLRSQNYIGHLLAIRHSVVRDLGGLRLGVDGAQDHDLIFRVLEAVGPGRIRQIPFVLYHWRVSATSVAAAPDVKPYSWQVGIKVVGEHLRRLGEDAKVVEGMAPNTYGVIYPTANPPPKITVIVPSRDQVALLSKCVDGLTRRTNYRNWELLIVDNASRAPETRDYLKSLGDEARIRIIRDDGDFNYARLNNRAASESDAPLLLFLNDDVEPLHEGWLDEMVRHCLRPGIGGVGAKLVYPDDTVQHAGVIIGAGGVAGHFEKHLAAGNPGYHRRAALAQNFQALTAACLLLRRSVFEQVGGFDAEHLKVNFNDVDLCLRIRRAGHRLVWTPYARLRHHESATRGKTFSPAQAAEHAREARLMQTRWSTNRFADPAYNPNLSLDVETPALATPPRVRKPWL